MVMTVYFDESGTHGAQSPATVVAGFGATAAQWVGCEKRLDRLFKDFGVTLFHATDFRGTKGDFEGWTLPQKAQFNSRFLQIVDDQLSFGVSGVVAPKNYKQHYRSQQFPRKVRPDSEYAICFRAALAKAVRFVEHRAPDWPLHVVLELGHKNAQDAIRVFQELRTFLPDRLVGALGTIKLASKADCRFLALADSFAYSLFRTTAGTAGNPDNPIAVPMGPADPPYYVHKIQMSRIVLRPSDLRLFHKLHSER